MRSIVRCIPQSASSAHPCAEKGGSERSELAHARTHESRVKLFIPPLHKSNHNSSNAAAKTITTDFNHGGPFIPHAAAKSHRSPVYHSVYDPCMRAVSLFRLDWRWYGANSENGEFQLLRRIFYYNNQITHHSNAFHSNPATLERPTYSLFAVSII